MLPRTIFVFISVVLCNADLMKILTSNPQCTKIKNDIERLGVLNRIKKDSMITLFAPTDDVYTTPNDILDYFNFHNMILTSNWLTIGDPVDLIPNNIGPARKIDKFHFFSLTGPTGTSHYVNNLKVVEADKQDGKTVVQITNRALLNAVEQDFWTFLNSRPDLTITRDLWTQLLDKESQNFDIAYPRKSKCMSTYFLVTNNGWSSVPANKMSEIKTDMNLLKQVLMSQMAPNQMIFSEWLESIDVVNFYAGLPVDCISKVTTDYTQGSVLTLSGKRAVMLKETSANIVSETIQIQYGNVFLIDKPIGFVYQTSGDILNKEANLINAICLTIDSCASKLKSADSTMTIFAPSGSTPSKLQTLPNQNKSELIEYMFIPTTLTSDKFSNQVFTINNLQAAIRLKKDDTGSYIEGRSAYDGYTRAKIIKSDLPTINGPKIQIIDDTLGVVSKSMREMIDSFNIFKTYTSKGFPNSILARGGKYSCLIPTDKAIESMASDKAVGEKLLQNSTTLDYIIRRHCFPLHLMIPDMKIGQDYEVPTANYAFTRETLIMKITSGAPNFNTEFTMNDERKSISVSSFDGAYGSTDGVWYKTDQVLYSTNDPARNLCTSTGC